MKKIGAFFIILLFLQSCSNDSSTEEIQGEPFRIPFNTGNYWTYNVSSDTSMDIFRDSLYVGNDIIMNTLTYKEMKVRYDVASGFYSNSLKNNTIRVSGNKLLLTGDLSLNAGQNSPINLDLTLVDFIAFDADAPLNGNSSTRTGSIQEVVGGYPLTINYKLKSVGGQRFANFTSSNGTVYSNVKTGKIILSASITTTQVISGFTITIPILPEQNILISEQFVAENIGVVYTNTKTTYTLNSGLPPEIVDGLGIPSTNTIIQEEFLDTYSLN